MFGERLKEVRKEKKLTLDELSDQYNLIFNAGLNKGTLSKYENNKQEPMISVVTNLADLLNVSVDYLLCKTNIRNIPEQITPLDIFSYDNILPLPKVHKIPLIGDIACGVPIYAEENIEDYINAPESVRADFCLRCHGDSMINARIHDGDLVFVKIQSDVENGQIAVVLIDNEATLKRVYKHKDSIVLQAENPIYPPIVIAGDRLDEVRIQGKAVAFLSSIH